ncbi:MAG: VOC family protein [Anaerotignum sp.]|nr:VOC family protein [Anaerotignum sp.]
MKFQNPLLVVTDMEASKKFYKEVLGLEVILDFGANVTLTGGVCLQTKETWMDFINAKEDEIVFGGKNAEIYFEEDDFDTFAEKLKMMDDMVYVHPVLEHRWGQRVVRFYDPDRHIIEVGENIKVVTGRFLDSGMTEEEVAERMDVPLEFVRSCKE